MSPAHLDHVRYPYTGSRDRFLKDVATHQMAVVLDTGTHKHLQFRRPDTGMYWFDILTWPGTLVIRGDMGTFVLAREQDMFGWIGYDRGRINPGYWSEKLVAGRDGVKEAYPDPDVLRAYVAQTAEDAYGYDAEDGDCLAEMCRAVDEAFDAIEWGDPESLRSISAGKRHPFENYCADDHLVDSWQWIWCCWAIVWAISKYREMQP